MSELIPAQPDPEPNVIALAGGVTVRDNTLDFTYVRSSGPGGQNVNKVNTKAILRVRINDLDGLPEDAATRLRNQAGRYLTQDDELVIQADDARTQRQNRASCLERLRTMIAAALVKPVPRRPRRVTRAMKRRRKETKQKQSEKKRRRRWRPE